jgi:alpha-tubulin suppressor-like RCC1 family protein
MDPLIKDFFSIVLKYMPLFQLYDMEKIYPKGMKYFLGKLSIGDKIRGLHHLSCGECHTMFISQEGHLYASRWNNIGQLGLGDIKNRNVFEKVKIYYALFHI